MSPPQKVAHDFLEPQPLHPGYPYASLYGAWRYIAVCLNNKGGVVSAEDLVAAHYTRGALEDRILASLNAAGKNLEELTPEDLGGTDEFHLGGRESTEALASFMHLHQGVHLLDVGCGIGGPARYFAGLGCQVTGIDLTAEFVAVAEHLTRMVKLDQRVTFREASALELPFDSASFDGAYEIHVGMNIPDKAGVFREVARVLKPGARFAIFDILRVKDGAFEFPVPWARSSDASFVASIDDYLRALESAGFRIEHQRERRQFALDAMQKVREQAASGPPILGIHLLMGEKAALMLKNVGAAIDAGVLEPVEFVAVAE
jgi:ubiquinone/menaquinone biosynthesis C-methylase UbiE